MLHRLVLGTAQIGLEKYGLANTTGKPSDAVVRVMFEEACEAGIRWLDTAQAYDDAEERIGALTEGLHFRISTKLRPTLASPSVRNLRGAVAQSVLESVRRLRETPDCVLFHRAEEAQNPAAMEALALVCQSRGIGLWGVSCYTPKQAFSAIASGATAIQVPLNLLDRRAMSVFPYAESRGVTVFCRAPFLQGAIIPGATLPPACEPARDRIALFHESAKRADATPAELALLAALSLAGEHRVVFGAETAEQLRDNLLTAGGPGEPYRRVLRGLSEAVVNPSLWADR